MEEKKVCGIIGITSDGYPIIMPDHVCRYFEADDTTTYDVKECWYCRYAMRSCWKTASADIS